MCDIVALAFQTDKSRIATLVLCRDLSGGGPAEGNITLRDHIEKGVIKGPRIIPSGRIDIANTTPEKAREDVRYAEIRKPTAISDPIRCERRTG